MFTIKQIFIISLLLLFTSLLPLSLYGENHQKQKAPNNKSKTVSEKSTPAPDFPSMRGTGKKVPLEEGYHLTYKFNKRPKLGTIIMKVVIFNSQGKKDTSLEITGDAGMPSMRGAHETGDRPFVLSKKREYLLPVNIVMPGDWEIRLTIKKAGKVIFRGSHQFDV